MSAHSKPPLLPSLLMGIEGLIDHQVLGIHHVRDDLGAPLGWDLGFLAFSLALMLLGWALAASGRARATASRRAARAER